MKRRFPFNWRGDQNTRLTWKFEPMGTKTKEVLLKYLKMFRAFIRQTDWCKPRELCQPQKLHPLLKFCPLPSFLVNSFEGLPLSDTSNHRPGRCLILTSHYQEIYLNYWTFLYIFWFYMIKDGLNFQYCRKIRHK